jgi:hypothetical protein
MPGGAQGCKYRPTNLREGSRLEVLADSMLRRIFGRKTPWPQSASELYRPRDHHLPAKLVLTFADRECHMVSATDSYIRNIGFLDRIRYLFFQVAPQLYSRGWVDPDSDPLPLRKSGSADNRTRDLWICTRDLWPLDHRGGLRERK